MSNKSYFRLTGLLFLIIFIIHLCRVVNSWEVAVSGTIIPMWVSWLALLVTGIFAYQGLKGIKNN